MFTLIKREIEDHIAYFIGAGILSGILIFFSILIVFFYNSHNSYDLPVYVTGFWIPVIIVLIIGLPGMGVTQMYMDRTRRISAFLSALPVTRGQILSARIVTGILAILTFLVPLTFTSVILLHYFSPPVPIYAGYSGFIFDIFIVTFLMSFACYCIGLLTGWTSSKITPTLGSLVLSFVLVGLILVKGFGGHIVVILALFIIASLVRTRHRFMSTSL